ncbi:MAG TPA: 4Fe-4S single cluster domain-containing protein [Kofleriaceae bacterium]|nr:4Fe-4S single cluster domain-containing protein [Kofleriaceae bacterium]
MATISDDTEAEGPGRRWALWLQGCPIRCPGCCNPEMFDERAGTAWSLPDLEARLAAAAERGVEGITLLGGEPFAQAAGAAAVARAAKDRGLTVMVFSGYTLAELTKLTEHAERADAAPLLALTDLLVDGPYDRERPEPPPPLGRRWIGSTNQVMHYLTAAYSPDEPRMRAPNTVELHWRDGRLLVNGWPAGADVLAANLRRGRGQTPS